jgi:hydroxyacyl-ACP dehydratase HTD2-like protein with hotdog domain
MTPATPAEPGPPQAIAQRDVQPREVDLFMFSAATWLTHRIHFDRDYARTEGFDDLVVHGPLQGAYLAELLSEAADRHGGRLARLAYRHHRPAYCAERLTLRATLSSVTEQPGGCTVEVAVSIHNARDQPVTTGTARLRMPGQRAVAGLLESGGTDS